jgi:Ca-activated chloride channel family protein
VRRLLLLVLVTVTPSPAAPQAPPSAAQSPQFKSSVTLVRLPVVVRARDGQLVRGLSAADFDVREDGRPQRIAHFVEGAPGGELPLHLGLVLDTSGSMEKDLRDATTAAIRFVQALEEAADVTFMDFDTSVRVGRFMPPSYPQLFERIRARKPGGSTALYDAMGAYLQGSMDREGQHVLLLYTDGGDSSSRMTFGKLQELLRMGNVMVYAVGYLEHQSSSERLQQQMRVIQIAKEAGGEAFFPTSAAEIHEVYARILDELASRYTIGYVSSNPKADGRFRHVEVKVTKPDLRGAKVRTRSGYMAVLTAPPR